MDPSEVNMEDKARLVAISTLYDMEINKSFSNIKLNQYFINYDLSSIDRAFATEIVYGTIRWKNKIDYLIQRNISFKISDVEIWTLICIRSAIYQMFFMDKVPEFAAVNVAVDLAKMKDVKSAGFVNGILRNILRNREEINNVGIKNKTKRLSIQYSHPEWFVRKFQKLYGEDFVIKLMEINNTPSELTARVNTLKISRSELIEKMAAKGFVVKPGNLDESIILKGYSMIEKSEEFKNGYFIFQDESSMLVTKVLNPQVNDIIIDVCSAPGGKATHIGQVMNNIGEILAFDIYPHKLELIKNNAEKLGIDIIRALEGNATVFNPELCNLADRVLIDAPCSGLGLIRKKPEIRWNMSEEDIVELSKLQLKILNNASKYLKPNGILVYSTCTITEEENEEVINNFLKENKNYKLENISSYLPDYYKGENCEAGYIKLFPNINKCDGFFLARLRKEW